MAKLVDEFRDSPIGENPMVRRLRTETRPLTWLRRQTFDRKTGKIVVFDSTKRLFAGNIQAGWNL